MIGHVAPEAASGGPIALLRDGDIVSLDVASRCNRDGRAGSGARSAPCRWVAPPLRFESGVMGKYARLVSSAAEGAITT